MAPLYHRYLHNGLEQDEVKHCNIELRAEPATKSNWDLDGLWAPPGTGSRESNWDVYVIVKNRFSEFCELFGVETIDFSRAPHTRITGVS